MSIVKQFNKKTGTTYVYESKSYWDPEKKQSRNKKKLLGKLDPVTGELIPTGPIGRPPKEKPAPDLSALAAKEREMDQKRILSLNKQIAERDALIDDLKKEVSSLQTTISQMKEAFTEINSVSGNFTNR